jgi:hypothetical protein
METNARTDGGHSHARRRVLRPSARALMQKLACALRQVAKSVRGSTHTPGVPMDASSVGPALQMTRSVARGLLKAQRCRRHQQSTTEQAAAAGLASMVLVQSGNLPAALSSRPRNGAARWCCTSLSTGTDEHCLRASRCAAGLVLAQILVPGLGAAPDIGTYACANWTARKAWDSPLRLMVYGERARGGRGRYSNPCEPYVGHSTLARQDRTGISIRA